MIRSLELARSARPLCIAAALFLAPFLTIPDAAAQEGPKEVETSALEQVDPSVKESARAVAPEEPVFDDLHRSIDTILAAPEFGDSLVGIYAVDVDTGEVLYARNADTAMNPASNIKLITGAAVLDLLGPQHTFMTRILAKEVEAGVVKGSLYVRGEGEAFLLFNDVLGWAGQLRQLGVKRVEGDIVIDDSAFDGGYLPPGYEQKNTDASYRSPIGAVSVNFNAITTIVQPGEGVGMPPKVRLDPPNAYIEVVNKAVTARGTRSRLQVSSQPNGEGTVVTIAGSIGDRAEPVTVRKRIDHPPLFAGSVVASALEMVGIEVGGTIRQGTTPDDARELMSHRSQPLANIVAAMNKWSNNFIAEQLLRVLGLSEDQPSTWDGSRQRVVAFLEKAGFEPDSYSLHNGSGLYDGNEVSPRQFVDLLRYMRTHHYGPEFLASLAIAGVDGTLKDRLKGPTTFGNLRGKTGTLNEVCALSGYVRTQSGRMVAFSILFNDTPRRAWTYRSHQDRIAEQLAAFDK